MVGRLSVIFLLCAALALFATLASCGDRAKVPLAAGFGPSPVLPAPTRSLFPSVNIAAAKGWPAGQAPTAAPGLRVALFAEGLDHPRWLHVLPNGDVLVAETNAPARPKEDDGVRGWFMQMFMKRAGAAVPSANRITLLRDDDGDGRPEYRSTLVSGLNSPFGMAQVGDRLYIANTDGVVQFPYRPGDTSITAKPQLLAPLPGGPRNHHWTKSLIASRDGSRLYATVGSNSNVAEHGMAEEQGRAAIWEVDRASGASKVIASGLRNPNGMAFEPTTGALWTVVNERDELGSDLVPDYLTSVQAGGFYGWPYSYFGNHVDSRAKPPRPDLVQRAIVPDYALGPHTASLGLAFYTARLLPARYWGGAFVGQHGSWNRSPPSGYVVMFIPFAGGTPSGPPQEILSGFLDENGNARGRPVGVAVDRTGALLVADDVGNRIWRVTPAG